MAEPLDLAGLTGLEPDNKKVCTIEASCVTGFEPMAAEEVSNKLGCEAKVHRGRVVFDIDVGRVKEVLKLRIVNTVWVMVGHTPDIEYPGTEEEQLVKLQDFADKNLDWDKGLEVWRTVTGFQGEMYPTELVDMRQEGEVGNESSPKMAKLSPLTFRCTCYRSGTNHEFRSTEVQKLVGGRVQEKFNWPVSCKKYDLEFVMNCDVKQVYCCINLTNISLFNRTVTYFGPCTLRPPISASLVMLAKLQVGEVVLDPMCGGGTISLEGCQMGPQYHIGGEIHSMAINRSKDNYLALKSKNNLPSQPPADFFQWDCLVPCLRDNSVDVIITDLPFGKRSGSKADNRVLYPRTLLSMARVVRPNTGRAVLLTQDKRSMFVCFKQVEKYWKHTKQISTNIGGLTALVFLISRTGESPPSKSS
eukprot:GFUD01032016.1.p1 GENE.GFUD01032016.1~~GFUD01032016.1.p1  ORF type:complete len:417 (+),score=115.55 GFUD01032016.1:37-1287(+)